MKAKTFSEWLSGLSELTPAQRDRLAQALSAPDPAADVARELEPIGVAQCPHCHAGAPLRYGRASGLQRYKCHACQRTFNALTATSLARLRHRPQWPAFAQALIEGESVRRSAQRAGVHRNTAFRWRHRFLAAPAAMQAHLLTGIAEADETLARRSAKGARKLDRPPRKRGGGAKKAKRGRHPDEQVSVLVMRDRSGHTLTQALAAFNHRAVDQAIGPRLDSDAVLCTDGAPVYRRLSQHRGLVHEPVNLAQGVRVRRPAFHVQNVNAYQSRWKRWMTRFHGVATHYLPHYLGWHRMLETLGEAATPHRLLAAAQGRAYQYSSVT